MVDQNDELICASAAFIILHDLLKRKKKMPKRWWQVTLLRNRSAYSGSNLLRELSIEEDYGLFKNFCRISREDFVNLLQLVELKIMKSDMNYRRAIPAIERLAVTLRSLATGDSYTSLMYTFKISKQAISKIVPEVCNAIVEVLQDNVKLPQTEEDWLHIAKQFEKLWNFPNCVGALDGKHVVIQAPRKSGSEFYNYKSTFSIVLMAVVDADYCFTFADVGCQGRISDGGVIRNTSFFKKL
nr:protein ALP1-like [Onthophagus taurus]